MPTQDELQAALDQLQTDVTELTSAEDGAVKLLEDINAQLKAALASSGPPQAQLDQVRAISAALDARTEAMAAAVVANTPAAA